MLNSCFFFDLTAFIELLFVPLSGISIWQKKRLERKKIALEAILLQK